MSFSEDDVIQEVDVVIEGITVLDYESAHMLGNIIFENLESNNLPFYLSGQTVQKNVLPGESRFLHTRFKLTTSHNARLLSKMNSLDIPQRFCCPLSADIMDNPVYDFRSPNYIYDYNFLMYWINKSYPRLMPDTKLPFRKEFLVFAFPLQNEINLFVKESIEKFELMRLEKTLFKYSLPCVKDKENLNKALLLATSSNNPTDDITRDCVILLREGANINYQTKTYKNNNTTLHLALLSNRLDLAFSLIHLGSHIDIPNDDNKTAFDLIMRLQDARLIQACEMLKLITVLNGVVSLVKKTASLRSSTSSSQSIAGPTPSVNIKSSEQKDATSEGHSEKKQDSQPQNELAKLLKEKYKQNTVNMESIGRALRYAAASNYHQDIPILLASGLKVDSTDASKKTALHWAITKGSVESVKILLQAGADVTLSDGSKTAKNYAEESKNLEIRTLFGFKSEASNQIHVSKP